MRTQLTALTLFAFTAACSATQTPEPRSVGTTDGSAPKTTVADARSTARADGSATTESSREAAEEPVSVGAAAPEAPAAALAKPGGADKGAAPIAAEGGARDSEFEPSTTSSRAGTAAKRIAKSSDSAMHDDKPRPSRPLVARSEASVRAGEWDDNANYREFKRYLASEASLPYERLDLSSRRFLVVRDANGKGVPNCRVTVADGMQHTATLTTTAPGRALLFPRAEGLVGDALSATASCQGSVASAAIDAHADDGIVDLRLSIARAEPARTLDLVFVLDTTGSMVEEIEAVKDTLRKVARDAGRMQTTLRVGLVEYRDRGDSFVTRVYPFSTDLTEFSRRIEAIQAGGGGDTPEHVNEGLRVALSQLAWNDAASARLAFLVADAPPHLGYQDDAGYARSLRTAAARGIQLYTVAASGMDALGQVVFRQTAQYTGATNMFVLRGGAGPQSTGGGDPKSSCGGTQSNYSSANLDQLIVAKLELTERLLELDPMRIAGVGRDETAKPCGERLVLAR